tara:strand:+ start:8499 stop:9008 length:510 start_codon:yes stop_codon:yes gene_type:complete
MLILAIDVGIKNLALCAYDLETNKIVFWDNKTLVPSGRYIPSLNVTYVRDFVARYQHLFDNAAVLLVERQMRCNMRIIEAVFQTLFYDRCYIIHARSVKAHYGLSTRNYRLNKQKAVEWATAFVKANTQVFEPIAANTFLCDAKQDDLADSLLLTMYYLDTYSNQLINQ